MLGVHVVKRFTSYLDPVHLQPWNFYFLEIRAGLERAGSQILIGLGSLILISNPRYVSLVGSLVTDRSLDRTAVDTGIEPSQLPVTLDGAIPGKREIPKDACLVLPGACAECGAETARLTSR